MSSGSSVTSSPARSAAVMALSSAAVVGEDYHFPADLISIQDRKNEALQASLMAGSSMQEKIRLRQEADKAAAVARAVPTSSRGEGSNPQDDEPARQKRIRIRYSAGSSIQHNTPDPAEIEDITPDTTVAPQSNHPSVLRNNPRGISSEYFQRIICDSDQDFYHNLRVPQLDRSFHQNFIQAGNLYNQISSRLTQAEEKVVFLSQSAEQSRAKVSALEQQMLQLQVQHSDLEVENEGKAKIIEDLRQQLSSTSTQAVHNFKHSEEGRDWVENRAADWFTTGFTRCRGQFVESGMFFPDTSLDFLDMNRSVADETPAPEFNLHD